MIKKVLLAASLAACLGVQAEVAVRPLHDGWRFRQQRSENWFPATVPGNVHTDLMANDLIEDPFFRLNERTVQWVDKEDWWYETTFTVTPEEAAKSNQQIVFYGLDCYAKIYLNHQLIDYTDNMHRTWRYDVKGILREGDNLLEVQFDSPIKVDLPKYDASPIRYKTGPDQSQNGGLFDKGLSPWARKASYQYGWDWGPRLVTSGIWRPVHLETWSGSRISDVQYIQDDVTASRAKLTTIVEVEADEDMPGATIDITADGRRVASQKADLKKGLNTVRLNYQVKHPRLWWTNGLGEPYLTKFGVTLSDKGKAVETRRNDIGLRSLRLVHEPDAEGHCLYFELNGKPVFAKGADMIPLDNFLGRVSHERYDRHVLDAKAANMNMLRVWGGGIYEDDYFYDLCDRNGIMVWQDFAFACCQYPADSAFLANVRQEAIDNVKRLRNHCSLALWCGNNEIQDEYYGWAHSRDNYAAQGVEPITTKQHKDLYFRTLPDVVKEYGGNVAYRPSSPYAFEETPSDGKNGDSHYWGVWHGRDSIAHYNVEKSRFFSEWGFQSFPEFESVKIYAPQERDWRISSEAMMCHQRAGSYANNLIRDYMDQEFRRPDDFPTFLYVGSVLQGDAVKTGFEAHRRDMPHCMGTLVWQHNDSWPVASWALRDYYGRWKAGQYYARKVFDDILVSPVVMNDTLSVTVVTERRTPARGKVNVRAMKLDGTTVWNKEIDYTASPLTSKKVFSDKVTNLLGGYDRRDIIFVADFTTGGDCYTNVAYPTKQKFMNFTSPKLTMEIADADGGYDVTIGTDRFTRALFMSLNGIDNFFSDNYFDMLPGSSRTIHVTTPLNRSEFTSQLKLISMGDIHDKVGAKNVDAMQSIGEIRLIGGD